MKVDDATFFPQSLSRNHQRKLLLHPVQFGGKDIPRKDLTLEPGVAGQKYLGPS